MRASLGAMDLRGQSIGWGRAAVAVAVLYAMLVAAFVPAPFGLSPADPLASLCLHDGSAPPDGQPAAPHDHRGCCTAALQPAALPTPEGAFAIRRPPAILLALVPLRPEAVLPRTGPPVRATSPRGPPLA